MSDKAREDFYEWFESSVGEESRENKPVYHAARDAWLAAKDKYEPRLSIDPEVDECDCVCYLMAKNKYAPSTQGGGE